MTGDETTMNDSAIVTGGGSGIGQAVARRLAEAGHGVVLFGRRRAALEETAASIQGDCAIVPGDVRSPADLQAAVAAADRMGGATLLINNAGIMPIAPMAEGAGDDWRDTIEVNVLGALHAIEAVLPGMRARERGHIVNISSVAGRHVFPGAAVYSASKSALDAISEGLRAELAADMKRGGPPIRVTSIAPGAVATDLTGSIRHAATREGTEAYYRSMMHVLTPDDVADAVCFAVEAPPHVCISEIVIRPTEMVR